MKLFREISLFLLCFILGGGQSFAQTENERNVEAEELQRAAKQNRENAVLSLKDNLSTSRSISNLRQQSQVIAQAAVTLWAFDKRYAQDAVEAAVNAWISEYGSLFSKDRKTKEEDQQIRDLGRAINTVTRAISRRDVELANALQQKFYSVTDKLGAGLDIDDRLKLADEGLDFDLQRSVNLVSNILQFGVPIAFPNFIAKLRSRHPEVASRLLQIGNFNLQANPNYRTSDAIYLSVAVFNEFGILEPKVPNGDDPNNFHIFTTSVDYSPANQDRQIALGFLAAYDGFFSSRMRDHGRFNFSSAENLVQSYFLMSKLKVYDRVFNLGSGARLVAIEAQLLPMMQASQITGQTLISLASMAERTASIANPLGLTDGSDLFDKADKSKDPRERLELLIQGIIQKIEFKKFAEAEERIDSINDIEIRDALRLFLNARASIFYISEKNWDEFERYLKKILDKRVRAFLYLQAMSGLDKDSDGRRLFDYSHEASKNLDTISDKRAKAAGYFYLTSLLFSKGSSNPLLAFAEALKALDGASDFEEDAFEIQFKIPSRTSHFAESIGRGAFQDSFEQLARMDYRNSQVMTVQIKSPGLRAIAEVATARAILN